MKKIFKLAISIFIPLIVGFLGSFFTSSSVNSWFLTLNKPSFNPPNWVFAPAWTILYILIGLSFYLVWEKNFGKEKQKVIAVYALQLFLNFLWSLSFFGLRNPLLGLINIIVLWLVIIANLIVFFKVSKKASYLLIPYLLWVSFASVLNISIFILN